MLNTLMPHTKKKFNLLILLLILSAQVFSSLGRAEICDALLGPDTLNNTIRYGSYDVKYRRTFFNYRKSLLDKKLPRTERQYIYDFVMRREMLFGLLGDSLLKAIVSGRGSEALVKKPEDRSFYKRFSNDVVTILEKAGKATTPLAAPINLDEVRILSQRDLGFTFNITIDEKKHVDVNLPIFPMQLNDGSTVPEFINWVNENEFRVEYLKWIFGLSYPAFFSIKNNFANHLRAQFIDWPNEGTLIGRVQTWHLKRNNELYGYYLELKKYKQRMADLLGLATTKSTGSAVSMPLDAARSNSPEIELPNEEIQNNYQNQSELLAINLAPLLISSLYAEEFYVAIPHDAFVEFKGKTLRAAGEALRALNKVRAQAQNLEVNIRALKSRIENKSSSKTNLSAESKNISASEVICDQMQTDLYQISLKIVAIVSHLSDVREAGKARADSAKSEAERIRFMKDFESYDEQLIFSTVLMSDLKNEIEALLSRVFDEIQSARHAELEARVSG